MSSSDASRNKKSARQSVELIDGEGVKGELDENKALAEKKFRFIFFINVNSQGAQRHYHTGVFLKREKV